MSAFYLRSSFLIFATLALTTSALAADPASSVSPNPALPQIPDKTLSLSDFGAVPDGKTLNTDAFKKAIAAVNAAGGGKLTIPKGTFRTLPFSLCSNLDLHLDEGAIIEAPTTFTEYGLPEPTTLKTQQDVSAQVRIPEPLINGRNLHDVAITGTGTIDGHGKIWWDWSELAAARAQPGRLIYPRQKLVVINGCQRLHVADVTFKDSPNFHLVPSNVTDLLIERVKIRAPFNAPNTDAIDPGTCTNVIIRNCDIDTGDDDIVIKTGGSNILIENCTIKHGHGISIGSGTTAGVHDMLVRNCTFDGADNGIRIKSMRGAGGPVENIRYSNIQMKNVTNPLIFDLTYVDNNRRNFTGDPTKVPSIQHILLENIAITGSKNAGTFIGLPDSPLKDITFRNVMITAEKDFVIKDAEPPKTENLSKTIQKGVAGTRPVIIE